MKVYTHFYPIEGSDNGFRWRTLLQFGDSWDIIGSAVMKNPGCAHFLSPNREAITDADTLMHLKDFDDSEDLWYEFTSDVTIDCIGDLFALYYNLPHRNNLNGIIQIFNLFYIRNADLKRALATDATSCANFRFQNEEDITEYDINHLVAPIYLGFANLARHKVYGLRAHRFFEAATSDKHKTTYLDRNFEKNSFTHPLYLMRYGKNKPESVLTRQLFIRQATQTND